MPPPRFAVTTMLLCLLFSTTGCRWPAGYAPCNGGYGQPAYPGYGYGYPQQCPPGYPQQFGQPPAGTVLPPASTYPQLPGYPAGPAFQAPPGYQPQFNPAASGVGIPPAGFSPASPTP